MAGFRYLTAQKISLLGLVKLYCTTSLPSSATIPILSFILSHITPGISSSTRARRPQDDSIALFSIDAFEDVLQPHASSMPGRTLLDVFLKQMWEMNTFDALHAFFDNLNDILVRIREEGEEEAPEQPEDQITLSRTSPLGIFVRRAKLEFTRLQFDDGMRLWSAFITYRAPTAKWTRRLAGLALSGIDANATELGVQPGDPLFQIAYGHLGQAEEEGGFFSVDDVERMLEFQLDKLQRTYCVTRGLSVLTPYRSWYTRSG
jgi:anaphase-promoting complex subunit 5